MSALKFKRAGVKRKLVNDQAIDVSRAQTVEVLPQLRVSYEQSYEIAATLLEVTVASWLKFWQILPKNCFKARDMDVLRSKARSKLSRSKNAIHSTLSSHEKRDVLVLEPSSSGKAEAVCQWIDTASRAMAERNLQSFHISILKDRLDPMENVERLNLFCDYSQPDRDAKDLNIDLLVCDEGTNAGVLSDASVRSYMAAVSAEMLHRQESIFATPSKGILACHLVCKPSQLVSACFRKGARNALSFGPVGVSIQPWCSLQTSHHRIDFNTFGKQKHKHQMPPSRPTPGPTTNADSLGDVPASSRADEMPMPTANNSPVHLPEVLQTHSTGRRQNTLEQAKQSGTASAHASHNQRSMNDLTSTQPLPASVLVTPVIRRMVLVNERAINDMKLGNVVMNDTRLMSRTEDEVMSCQCNYGGKDGGNVLRCSTCGTYQHRVCYGNLEDDQYKEHYCYECLLGIDDQSRLRQMRSLVRIRRALWLLYDERRPACAESFVQHFEWSREEAERVLEKLQEIGFLPSTWKPEGASSSQVIEGEKQRALREVYTNPMHLLDIYYAIEEIPTTSEEKGLKRRRFG